MFEPLPSEGVEATWSDHSYCFGRPSGRTSPQKGAVLLHGRSGQYVGVAKTMTKSGQLAERLLHLDLIILDELPVD